MKMLCTLGPASLNDRVIKKMTAEGVDLFRLNLSHMKFEDLAPAVELIRKSTKVPVCFDSEGAQVRTGYTASGQSTYYALNEKLEVSNKLRPAHEKEIVLTPHFVVEQLQSGDLITLDFNSLLVVVEEVFPTHVTVRVLEGGLLGNNKAVSLRRPVNLPAYSDKDRMAFALGAKLGIDHYALSFANRAEDVIQMRDLVPKGAKIISKIECIPGLANLSEIIRASDSILIDRGDLSREVGIEYIPSWQKRIIRESKKIGKEVYVATNFLETMIGNPTPTRAEVNDIFNTLLDGASGIVLAAETAIGKYPVQAVRVVKKMMKIIADDQLTSDFEAVSRTSNDGSLSLITPHGGQLILKSVSLTEKEKAAIPRAEIDEKTSMDCELLSNGTYSPLNGLMNSAELDSVLKDYKYHKHFWPMPVLLLTHDASAYKAPRILLSRGGCDEEYVLENPVIEKVDPATLILQWFGTTDPAHPGVTWILSQGSFLVSGEVKKVKTNVPVKVQNFYAPVDLRYIFEKKGWARVVAFHTRNIPHKGHEYIQQKAMERVQADGLLISPILGPRKTGDFKEDVVIDAYRSIIDKGVYEQVLISGLYTYPRYAGPREALFTALCRQNMGCTHIIIGRDHTGVGKFYESYDSQEIFRRYGDQFEIAPVFFDEVTYLEDEKRYEESKDSKGVRISATFVRDLLKKGKDIPAWLLRDEVYQVLQAKKLNGSGLYAE